MRYVKLMPVILTGMLIIYFLTQFNQYHQLLRRKNITHQSTRCIKPTLGCNAVYMANQSELQPARVTANIRERNVVYIADQSEPLRTYLAGAKGVVLTRQLINGIPLLISPSVCSNTTQVVIFVPSTPNHHTLRHNIRQTWAAPGPYIRARVLFMLGHPQNNSTQTAILKEAERHDDIVQFDYVDAYRNLTYKQLLAYRWLVAHCAEVPLTLKCDDDVMINMYLLTKLVNHKPDILNGYYCQLFFQGDSEVLRSRRFKHDVTLEEYPGKFYPAYCSGFGYIIETRWLSLLLDAANGMPFFWIDDVFITGLLASRIGIRHVQFYDEYGYADVWNPTGKRTAENGLFVWMEGESKKNMTETKYWRIILDRWANDKSIG